MVNALGGREPGVGRTSRKGLSSLAWEDISGRSAAVCGP
jgi:hypothetical protein